MQKKSENFKLRQTDGNLEQFVACISASINFNWKRKLDIALANFVHGLSYWVLNLKINFIRKNLASWGNTWYLDKFHFFLPFLAKTLQKNQKASFYTAYCELVYCDSKFELNKQIRPFGGLCTCENNQNFFPKFCWNVWKFFHHVSSHIGSISNHSELMIFRDLPKHFRLLQISFAAKFLAKNFGRWKLRLWSIATLLCRFLKY